MSQVLEPLGIFNPCIVFLNSYNNYSLVIRLDVIVEKEDYRYVVDYWDQWFEKSNPQVRLYITY